MSETLTQSHPVTQDIITLAAASLSAAPHLTEAERTTRSQTVLRGTEAFQPEDATQTVLASLVLGHHLVIMDGFRDIACLTLTPAEVARARMVTVAQTKLVLQLVRELRTAREDARTRAPAAPQAARPGEPAPKPAGETANEAFLARFLTTYGETLATLENAGPLTPAAAAQAREALTRAIPPAPAAAPEVAPAASESATASRAQRRAMMKRLGAFKRTA
jgi:hypothetical protein